MKVKLGTLFFAIMLSMTAFGFGLKKVENPDLSTPQKSFSAFVDVLKAGNVEALPKVATQTGQISLGALYTMEAYQAGMADLGDELDNTTPEWIEITEDIFFAACKVEGRLHKMEFTKEDPGWMLYHWQIGGGADHLGTPTSPEEAE